MGFVENIEVGLERAEAGIGAKENRPAAIFDAGIVCWVGITEDSSAEGDELARTGFGTFHPTAKRFDCVRAIKLPSLRSARDNHFREEHFERADVEFFGAQFRMGADCAGE